MRTLLLRKIASPAIMQCKNAHSDVSKIIEKPLNYINGRRVKIENPFHSFDNIQPATGQVLCTVPAATLEDVNSAVQAAHRAYCLWSKKSGLERGQVLTKAASLVRERLEEIAQIEVVDTGKPIWEARADISGCADVLEYYGGIANTVCGYHQPLSEGNFAIIQREPLGVVAGIGAWNYPFQVMTWKVAPALACGNTFVYKPSQFTPLSAVVLAEIFSVSGAPNGVVNVIQGEGETGNALCRHPQVAKITFTGSIPTGQKIMKACADGMKKVTLELGGKSPLIVFEDSDIEEAVKATMLGNFLTQGEVCSNCTRVFVHCNILQPFVDKLAMAAKKMVIGDPMDEATTVGATITKGHAEKVLGYVKNAQHEGAVVVYGGERVIPKDPKLSGGYYLSPCILTNCQDHMKVVQEEIFGSVVSVLSFESEEEVIRRANATPFGLAAGVMTKDLQRAHRVASALQAGIVWINNYNVFPPELPFGGYKMSGFGRENGIAAINDFSQLKTVYVEIKGNVDCPIYKA